MASHFCVLKEIIAYIRSTHGRTVYLYSTINLNLKCGHSDKNRLIRVQVYYCTFSSHGFRIEYVRYYRHYVFYTDQIAFHKILLTLLFICLLVSLLWGVYKCEKWNIAFINVNFLCERKILRMTSFCCLLNIQIPIFHKLCYSDLLVWIHAVSIKFLAIYKEISLIFLIKKYFSYNLINMLTGIRFVQTK